MLFVPFMLFLFRLLESQPSTGVMSVNRNRSHVGQPEPEPRPANEKTI